MRKAALFAPRSARAPVGLSAPKLIAEILKTEAEYGLGAIRPAMVTELFGSALGFGATEWCIHS